MIHTARQLKALVRNKSNSDNQKAQTYIRIYAMERFLERLSCSRYKENFVLKGGILVSSMVGVNKRSTMDIDTTIRNQSLSIPEATRIVEEIAAIPLEDGMTFEVKDVTEIMEEAEYSGVRIHMTASLEKMRTPIKIDISTGDVITPHDIRYSYKLMFEERYIELFTYNLATILAEKIETVISRGTANTRLRDYYDVYVLTHQYEGEVRGEEVRAALAATSRKRGSQSVIADYARILNEISTDAEMQQLWRNYQSKFDYAADVEWGKVMVALRKLSEMAVGQSNGTD